MPATLVLPAAGSGRRFASDTPKQFLPLAGVPVICRTLAAFSGLVQEAVIAIDPGHRELLDRCLEQAPPALPVRIVAGGARRQDTVALALAACATDLVLVHDAVRPLVPRGCIAACLAALAAHAAAIVAVPCAPTVKRSDDGGTIAATVPRGPLWLAQTPQGLRREPALAAFARSLAEGWECSDDAEVMERAGHRVALVPGDACNVKLTTRDDLRLAEALLALQSRATGASAAGTALD